MKTVDLTFRSALIGWFQCFYESYTCRREQVRNSGEVYEHENSYKNRMKGGYTHTSFIENSTEAGNLLRGNDAMLGARTRIRMQSVLVTMMFICLIARLLK